MASAISLSSTTRRHFTIGLHEILHFAYDAFCSNKLQFTLTALAMSVGTASVILVATIGLTGKQYILRQLQSIGTNMIYADYEGGAQRIESTPDPMTVDDVQAVREQVSSVVAASPTVALGDRISVGAGKQRDILVLGVDPEYQRVRNLKVLAGRFFDDADDSGAQQGWRDHRQAGAETLRHAFRVVGQIIKLSAGLPFTIVGVFKESVDTFGQSEIQEDTMLIPYTVSRFFTPTGAIRNLFFRGHPARRVARDRCDQARAAVAASRRVGLQRAEPDAIAQRCRTIADALTWCCLLVAFVTLLVSGIGIMNIMLATVTSRIREIGIRKAIGATNREIRFQFLAEAILISLVGGIVGIVIGLAIPSRCASSPITAFPSLACRPSSRSWCRRLVGIIFGTVPATRAVAARSSGKPALRVNERNVTACEKSVFCRSISITSMYLQINKYMGGGDGCCHRWLRKDRRATSSAELISKS